ncbi:MAG: NTP transferase domain-containing protein, partial [Desulfonatronovibrio sp.]
VTEKFAAIILAAGNSTRMGACKQLLPVDGTPMLDRCIHLMQTCLIHDIIVVVRDSHEAIIQRVRNLNALLVINPDSRNQDMFSSVMAGTSALPASATAFFVLPCDIPLVKPDTINTLRERWIKAGSNFCGILKPVYKERCGHPPLIHRGHIYKMRTWKGQGGMGGYFRGLSASGLEKVIYVQVNDPGIMFDMDTPQDLNRAKDYLSIEKNFYPAG